MKAQIFSLALLESDTGRRRFHSPMPDRINTSESSPDGRWIAVGCRDGTLRVIDAENGARVAEFRHEGQVRRLAWVSQDRIVSVGYDNWVRIWELSTRRQVTAWDTGEYLREVVVSRSGGWLAFGGDHRRATIVDISSLAVRFEMPHPGWVTAMAASKSGKLLATGDRLGNIRVWDAVSGRPLIDLLSTEGFEVRRLAFSLDGGFVSALSVDRNLRCWSVSDGRILGSILPMEVEPQTLGWLTSNRVVTVTPRGTSQVWSMDGLTLEGDSQPLREGIQRAISSDSGRWTALHLGDKGVFVEVDLEYPVELHDSHNNYPLAPESRSILKSELSPYQLNQIETHKELHNEKIKKLVPNLYDKKNYVCHIIFLFPITILCRAT
jgi:hypothetical protein